MLVSDVPTVFRAEIYAIAALAGAIIVVAGNILGLLNAPVALLGALVCFLFMILSVVA